MRNSESPILNNNYHKVIHFCSSKKFIGLSIIIGVIILLCLLRYNLIKYAILSSFILFGFVLSLLFAKLKNKCEHIISQKLGYLLLTIFLLSFSMSIIYLQTYAIPYTKPFLYYLLIGICSSCIYLITFSEIHKNKPLITLLVLLIFILNAYSSTLITFLNGVYASGDSHYQIYNIVVPIIEKGIVPQGQMYSSFPLHQILVAVTSITCNYEVKYLYLCYPSILYTILGLYIYCFSKRIFHDTRTAVISVLLYSISPDVVYHATHAYQFSYAAPIGIMLLLLSMMLYTSPNDILTKDSKIIYKLIFILLICTLVGMHQYTSGVVFSLYIILCCISILFFKHVTISSCKIISILFVTIILCQWIIMSASFDSFVHLFSTYYTTLTTPENYQAAVALSESGSISEPSVWIIFSNIFGIGLIFIFTTIGSVYGICKNNGHIFIMSISALLIWSLVSVGSFIKMPILLNSRLLTFSWAAFISLIAAWGIVYLSIKFGRKGIIGCCLLLFIMTIFNLGTPLSGSETSFLLGDTPYIKLYDTNEDINSYFWIEKYTPHNSHIKLMSESWVPQYYDPTRHYSDLAYTDKNNLDLSQIQAGEYILLSKYSSKGIRINGIDEKLQLKYVVSKERTSVDAYMLHSRIVKINFDEIQRKTRLLNQIYSNGNMYIKL